MRENWYIINDLSYNRELHIKLLKRLSENHKIVFRREFLFYDEIPDEDKWEFSKEWLDIQKEKLYPDKNLCYKSIPDMSFRMLIDPFSVSGDIKYDWYIVEDEKRFIDLVNHSFTYNVMITDDISDYKNSLFYMEYIELDLFTLAINDLTDNIDNIREQLQEVTDKAIELQKYHRTLK